MINMKKHISILGKRVRDRVTGVTGVVTSVSFDLYGCIQATVHRGLDESGNIRDVHWFDINRLEIVSYTPVMEPPDFEYGDIAEGKKGAAEKPAGKC